MKLCAVWVLLFCVAFSLYAQTSAGVSMYIPPVDGTSAEPEDNDFITDLLNREMSAWNFLLAETQNEADYSLLGTITHAATEEGYILSLALQDKEGLILYSQELKYTTVDEVNSYLPSTMLYMFSSVFAMHLVTPAGQVGDFRPYENVEPDPDAWRNKDFYIGVGAFLNPRLYYGDKPSTYFSVCLGVLAEFYFIQFASEKLEFLKYMALRTGLEIADDWVVATSTSGDTFRNRIFQIPLSLDIIFRPGNKFMIEPYLGVLFNLPIYNETVVPYVSWMTGSQFGFKCGPGVLYLDARFSMDFGKIGLNANRPTNTR
jgi:hypothetical protein